VDQGPHSSAIIVHWQGTFFSPLSTLADTPVDTTTQQSQWEPPTVPPAGYEAPHASGHTKKRQYAAGQTHAYYGGETIPDPVYGVPPVANLQTQPQSGQLFTPGLAVEGQMAAQQAAALGQQPYYGQPDPAYPSPGAAYGAQPGYGQPPVDALANQFGHMNMGQKQFTLYTTNLLTSPPDPRELQRPPPEIRLPPNSCISPSPTANADPSYCRSTINAIPTTGGLLTKSKLPLALVLTPYRSLNEGEEQVPLITDTVIARCRRCRTYINPYVQFVDGGNR